MGGKNMIYKNNRVEDVKIAYIGGGSRGWAWTLMKDLAKAEDISGSVYLYDIDYEAAKNNETIGNRIEQGAWKYVAAPTIGEALTGADFVIVSILPGTFDEMESDVHAPEKYGIYQPVGDTTGPGGFIRSLRTVPMMQEIARAVREFCPKAWVINYTNPMAICVHALYKEFPEIKAFGCCHEVFGTQKLLAHAVNEYKGYDAISLEHGENDYTKQVRVNVVGVNHFTVLKELTVKGVDDPFAKLTLQNYIEFEKNRKKDICSGTVDDIVAQATARPGHVLPHYLNFMMAEQWGFFPLAGSSHVCESLPGINVSPDVMAQWSVYRKGVLPNRPQAKQERRSKLENALKEKSSIPEAESRSKEMVADAAVALLTGEPRRIIAACANRGQIDDLPRDVTVETWALASRCGVHPVASGKVPLAVKGFMEQIICEEELAVEAALTGNFDALVQALTASPMVQDKRVAPALAKELVEGNRQHLPQFEKV